MLDNNHFDLSIYNVYDTFFNDVFHTIFMSNGDEELSRKEKKESQFKSLLKIGTQLFLTYNISGFSLRSLAKLMNMTPANIYNYVKNKRELWYAILLHEHRLIEKDVWKILERYDGDIPTQIKEMGNSMINFVTLNPEKYKMLYLHSPPPLQSEKGPYEIEFSNYLLSNKIIIYFESKLQKNELYSGSIENEYYFLASIIDGICRCITNTSFKLHSQNILFDFKEYSLEKFNKIVDDTISSIIN